MQARRVRRVGVGAYVITMTRGSQSWFGSRTAYDSSVMIVPAATCTVCGSASRSISAEICWLKCRVAML